MWFLRPGFAKRWSWAEGAQDLITQLVLLVWGEYQRPPNEHFFQTATVMRCNKDKKRSVSDESAGLKLLLLICLDLIKFGSLFAATFAILPFRQIPPQKPCSTKMAFPQLSCSRCSFLSVQSNRSRKIEDIPHMLARWQEETISMLYL